MSKNDEVVDYSHYVYYDETSPSCLRWKVDVMVGKYYKIYRCRAGDVVGTANGKGYYLTRINYKNLSCHRIVYEIKYGVKLSDSDFIDHIDGNNQNNKYQNLRAVSKAINSRNCRISRNNSTGITGVFFKMNAVGNTYAVANWMVNNKVCNKYFSVDKLGIMVAFKEAALCRKKKLAEMNLSGAGYTTRHGI
jgi:hypothetical protein